MKRNPEVLQRLRAMIRTVAIPAVVCHRKFVEEGLNYMGSLVDHQLVYHQNTVSQYEKICRKLQFWANTIFFISIGIVAARAGIQVIIQITGVPGCRFEIQNVNAMKSATNMLALLIPAVAAHFALKLSSCNFEGLLDSNQHMVNDLSEIKKVIQNERQREHVNFEDLYRLSRELTGLILGEVSDWYAQLTGKKIAR